MSGTFSLETCVWNYTATGEFVDGDLRVSLHGISPTDCYDTRMAIRLTKHQSTSSGWG
jgi:hypothetical protein